MKEFTLTVTEQELNVLSAGLVKLPYEVVVSIISKLQAQINSQTTPKEEASDVESN